jgi:pimeloyl-ACP methyl ester carboxylesterase
VSARDHLLRTADGWSLHLRRYPAEPAADGPGARGPVLFVHGMGANRYNFDLNPRHSLAQAAAREGFDAWVVELRGRGRSRPPAGVAPDFCFDDFLAGDLPTVLEFLAVEAPGPVHWVGHSMGGMLGVAWAIRQGCERLRSLVLFGTPLRFDRSQWGLQAWSRLVALQRFLPTMDQRALGRRFVPLLVRGPRALKPFLRFLANPDNVDPDTTVEIFERLVANEPPGLILQFADWVRSGEFRSRDGSTSYTRNLDRVRVPVLAVCGDQDRMAPAAQTASQPGALPGAQVERLVLSRAAGFSADYGHGDLLVGRRAPEEVYPRVLAWLGALDGRGQTP